MRYIPGLGLRVAWNGNLLQLERKEPGHESEAKHDDHVLRRLKYISDHAAAIKNNELKFQIQVLSRIS